MENTTFEGFDILIDYTSNLHEALKAIEGITGKTARLHGIHTEHKSVFVKLGR